VVIDAPSYIHDTLIPALEAADDILIVTTLDLASVQNLKQVFGLAPTTVHGVKSQNSG